jgi:hypothetical protein
VICCAPRRGVCDVLRAGPDNARQSTRRKTLEDELPAGMPRTPEHEPRARSRPPETRAAAFRATEIQPARRLLGWTMTVLGIALMAGGAASVLILG